MKKIISFILCFMLTFLASFNAQTGVSAHANDGELKSEIDKDYVQKVDFSSFNNKINEDDELYKMLKEGLLNANKYALTTWFNDAKNLDEDTNEYYDLKKASGNSTVNEYIYRFPATQAFGVAIALQTGIYDEAYTGVSKEEAKEIALKLVTSIAYGHKVNGGNYQSWGDDWQAAHWAYFAGYTAWLMWDDLSSKDQELIKNMIVYEANRFNNLNAVYWKTVNGKELYIGDSKIEEDGWNAELINLAALMFPKHENKALWEYRATEYQLAAFANHEMTQSEEIVHGRAAKDWVYGYNVNDNGTVINHGIVHPTYNAASTGVNTSIVNSLLHKKLPLAAKYNLDKLYNGLTKVDFKVEDGYLEPGGTIYTEDSYQIYCPQGNDWGGEIYDVYVNIDVSAYVYGYGDNADKWAKLHLQKVLDQQRRHEDRHTYKDASENSYAGREEAISMRLGSAFMTYWLGMQEPVEYVNNEVKYPAKDLPEIDENMQRLFASEGIYVKDGGSGDTNFYPEDIIQVKKDGAGYYREGFVKYNLKELNANPNKAEILIPIVSLGANVESAGIQHVVEVIENDTWNEETLTYKNKPSEAGVEITRFYPTEDGLTVDVTDYVRKAYNNNKNISFRVYSIVQVGGDTFVNYGSPRQADPNYRPQMLLTYGDDAELSLIGSENSDTSQNMNLSLEGNNLHLGSEYEIEIDYDHSILDLTTVTASSNELNVDRIDKTYANKATVYINHSENPKKLLDLVFKPVGKGSTEVATRIMKDGNVLLETKKSINVTSVELTGRFLSKGKIDLIEETIDDTTVRMGDSASANGNRDEMETKTYGNNGSTRQLFAKFPLPVAKVSEIDTVSLNLFVNRLPNGACKVRFQYLDDNGWTEETLDWDTKPERTKAIDGTANTIPAVDENTLSEQTISERDTFVTIDVTEKVKQLVSEGKTEISVFAYASVFANNSVVFNTKEHKDASTRPYVHTTFKRDQNVELSLNPAQKEVKRFETVSYDLTAHQLGDLEDPVIEVSYSDLVAFDGVETLNSEINVEVVEVLKNSVRIKLSKENDIIFDDSTDLIQLKFKALSSGTGNIQVNALDEDGNTLEAGAEITVLSNPNKQLNVALEGNDIVRVNEIVDLNALFTSLTPGVEYNVNVNYDKKIFDITKLYSINQNLVITPVNDDDSEFKMLVLESDKDYSLGISMKVMQEFNTKEIVGVQIDDEGNIVNANHTFECKKEIPAVDKTNLQEMINQANQLKEADYTAESWRVVKEALDLANQVYVNADASQKEVDDMCADLQAAMDQLEKIKKPTDPSDSAQPDQPTKPETPDTGDTTNVFGLTFLLLISLGGVVAVRKKQHCDN